MQYKFDVIESDHNRIKNSNRKIKVSIHNETNMPAAYLLTEKAYRHAAAKYPDIASHLDVRFFYDANDIPSLLDGTEVLIASLMGGNLPLKSLLRAEELRWVHFIGAGVDHLLPLDWLPSGAVLTKSLGAHLPIATEYAVAGLLMLNNSIPYYITNQRKHHWERIFSSSIRGKTLVVIGVGTIGGGVASVTKALGMRVLGVRRSGEAHESVDEIFRPDGLGKVLPQADFVFVSPALTNESHQMVGAAEFASMKQGAGLVSIARGGVMDFEALAQALHSGHLSGAVINAFPSEPLPQSSFIWDTPNLIVTPHIGTQDRNLFPAKVLDVFFGNMDRYMTGTPMRFKVDPSVGY